MLANYADSLRKKEKKQRETSVRAILVEEAINRTSSAGVVVKAVKLILQYGLNFKRSLHLVSKSRTRGREAIKAPDADVKLNPGALFFCTVSAYYFKKGPDRIAFVEETVHYNY